MTPTLHPYVIPLYSPIPNPPQPLHHVLHGRPALRQGDAHTEWSNKGSEAEEEVEASVSFEYRGFRGYTRVYRDI